MSNFYAKLVCGNREVNLCDMSTYNLRAEGFDDDGQNVTLTWVLKDANKATATVYKLIHELDWFNHRAIEYAEEHVGQPVWLGIKADDGNPYDTVFGRGYLWKQLYGRHSESEYAIQYDAVDISNLTMYGRLDEFKATFRCRERKGALGERIFPWETREDRWIGIAQGGIRQESYGGIIIEPATTSFCTNSSFENEGNAALGWTASASVTASSTADPAFVYAGYFGMILANAGAASGTLLQSITAAASNSLRFYAKLLDGSAATSLICGPVYNGAAVTGASYTLKENGFYAVEAEDITGTGGAASAGIWVAASKSIAVDLLDWQNRLYLTSPIYGNMGRGFSFSGTAHQSSSIRAVGGLSYRNADSTVPYELPREKATVLFITKTPRASSQYNIDGYLGYCGSLRWHWDQANSRFEFTDGTNTATSASATFVRNAVLYVFVQYGSGGLRTDSYTLSSGTATSLASGSAAAYAAPAPSTPLYVGSNSTPAYHWGGEIQEVQCWAYELTETQRQARVTKGRGWAELPYLWSHTGTGTIYNCDDSVNGNRGFVEIANVPGDYDAGAKIHVKQNTASITPLYIYVGQMRRALPRTDLPAFRHYVGCHYDPFLEAEGGLSSYDANSTTAACSSGSTAATGGCAVKTVPSTTTNTLRVKVPVCNEPENLWKYHGIWRVIGRFRAATADQYKVQYQVITAKNSGPNTPQFYLEGDSVWRPGLSKDQVVTIPSYYVDPSNLQEFYRPGDWAATSSSAFCYIEYNLEAETASGSVYCDGLLLLPQDYEAYGKVNSTSSWPQNYYLVMDTASHEHRSFFAYDNDKERFHDGVDMSGKFHLPVHEPCAMTFVHRRSGTGNPWVIGDQMVITGKYRPRYKRLR